jgi:hypothetical protein
VHDALTQSAAARPAKLRAMAAAARARVAERFSPEAIWPRIAARLTAIAASRK